MAEISRFPNDSPLNPPDSDPLALAFGALDRQSTANESNDDSEDDDDDSNSLERERKEIMASNYRVLRERGLAGQTMMEV